MSSEILYRWKDGACQKVSIEVVAGAFEEIYDERKQRITPDAVLEYARPVASPLHQAFEWDDSVAAEKYRLDQAKEMIRSVVIVTEPGRPQVRAFVSVVQDDEQERSYTRIFHAMAEPALRDQVLERARGELLTWRNRYQDLREFAKVHRAIDETVKV